MESTEPNGPPDGWPDCEAEQVRVMLLGTVHLDNPGLDEGNPEVDDVLASDRQAQLRELTGWLARWNPDKVALERPYDAFEAVNGAYAEFRAGERRYDEEQELPSFRADRFDVEPNQEVRSEVVQVGFRLAAALDYDRVYPVDAPAVTGVNDELEALEEREFRPERKAEYSRTDPLAFEREVEQRLAESTVTELLRWMNREAQLRPNHEGLFEQGVRWGEGDNFGGPRMLATWYDRNLRMVHNVWRTLDQGDERVLFPVGAGHVRVLRHLFTEAPMFCPVSPLPYLEA